MTGMVTITPMEMFALLEAGARVVEFQRFEEQEYQTSVHRGDAILTARHKKPFPFSVSFSGKIIPDDQLPAIESNYHPS